VKTSTAHYGWLDVVLWIIAIALLIPFLAETVGALMTALEPVR
jgi:hypothetical protein